MNNPKTACNQPLLRRLTLLALPALVAAAMGCGPEQQSPEPLAEAKHEVRAPSETMTPALRAAYIANVQATASHDYALKTTSNVLKAHNAAQRFDVEMGELVSLRLPGDERLSFDLAGVSCEGGLRAVGKARPVAAGNRVEYVRRGGEADDLTEWYVHGPLGLEQGFTLGRPLDCGTRELVIDVGMGGSLAPSMAAQGKAVLLRNAVGRAVARYSDLYVVDAAGRELPSKLEVVGRSVRIRFDERAAVYPVRVDPLVAVEQAMLLASDGQDGDHFGASVAVSGDTALVSAPGADAAYVFVLANGSWTQQAKLETSGGGVSAVAVAGNTAVLGDGSDSEAAYSAGAVHVFERVGSTWSEVAKLMASDAGVGYSLGDSVAAFEDTIIAGARNAGDYGLGSGAAYIFSKSEGVWAQEAKLVPSDGEGNDPFTGNPGDKAGQSVALYANLAVVGAPHRNGAVSYDAGATYVFERVGTMWSEQAKLIGADVTGVYMGYSVAIWDETVLTSEGVSGAADVFVRSDGEWTKQTTLTPNRAAGRSVVAISGDAAVLGQKSIRSGTVFPFVRSGDVWTDLPAVSADPFISYTFGQSVAMAENTIIVGDAGAALQGIGYGAAYVYVLRSTDGTPCMEADECASGNCADGVCCNLACDAGPCDACAVAAGASIDGTCEGLTGPTCDDGNACTQVDTCQAGECTGDSPVACPPTDACHDNCDPATGQCAEIAKPDGTSCDDGNVCTLADECQAGICVGNDEVTCTALDDCHDAGACDPTTGVCDKPARPDGSLCAGGLCRAGQCESDEEDGPVYVVDGGCACEAGQGGEGSNRWLPLFLVAAAWTARRNAPRRRSGRSSGREVFLTDQRITRVSSKLPPARPSGTRHGSPQNR